MSDPDQSTEANLPPTPSSAVEPTRGARRKRKPVDDGCRLTEKPLNRREQRFVAAYVDLGEIKAAAREAGYSASFAQASAYRLLRRAAVLAAGEGGVAPPRPPETVRACKGLCELGNGG